MKIRNCISTIKAKVLEYSCDTDLSNNTVLSDLIKSFEHERPIGWKSCPKWNLKLVLVSLTHSLYEPMNNISLKHLILKTVFLLTLDARARRSEIHAIDTTHITLTDSWKSITLAPNPKFINKNFDYSTGKRNFQGFTIEAMKHRLGPGLEEEALLCPVRALRWYLHKTKDLRGNRTRLFISY